VLLDVVTGFPLALVNANYLNGFRTAAADAAAVAALSRPDAAILGVLGAGHQAAFDIRAIARVRALRLIKIWNRTPHRAHELRAELGDLAIEIRLEDRLSTVAGSDILVTVTGSTEPLIFDAEVSPGTHISAMGADRTGKQELDVSLVMRSRLFADDVRQSTSVGEFQHVARAAPAELTSIAPLGAVLSGDLQGRVNPDEITIFDSSGIALQDLLIAQAVLRAAEDRGLVQYVEG
jgi:ornithine cyclodeaminase